MAKLFAFREDRLGFHYDIGKRAVMGRAPDCDLLIFDRSASRHHCEIFMLDDKYFIADLDSTNGTLVNDKPITMQTRLEPFDSIKIGQEVFIFEPGIQGLVGPAPSALIVESLVEEVNNLLAVPAEQAAVRVDPADVPELMLLAYRVEQISETEALAKAIFQYLEKRFAPTFVSILWPSMSPARRLVSLISPHEDKRLMLSHTPFIRAVRDRDARVWPKSITELSFQDGRRQVQQDDHPCLVGPLVSAGYVDTGLMCVENQRRTFTDKDLWAFAAFLGISCPALTRLAKANFDFKDEKHDQSAASEFFLSTSDHKVKVLLSTASQAAEKDKPVLLTGEAGSGKLALAEFIHNISPRKNGRLIIANLATISPADIEATLFGQLSAGSDPGRAGLVEMADGGTLFLRHVEKLPPAAQKLLLMAIEEGIYFNLGAARPKAVDLRVISATSHELWDKVEAGQFREDLYLRLSATTISLPPLSDIKQDFAVVLHPFLKQAARALGFHFGGRAPPVP